MLNFENPPNLQNTNINNHQNNDCIINNNREILKIINNHKKKLKEIKNINNNLSIINFFNNNKSFEIKSNKNTNINYIDKTGVDDSIRIAKDFLKYNKEKQQKYLIILKIK